LIQINYLKIKTIELQVIQLLVFQFFGIVEIFYQRQKHDFNLLT